MRMHWRLWCPQDFISHPFLFTFSPLRQRIKYIFSILDFRRGKRTLKVQSRVNENLRKIEILIWQRSSGLTRWQHYFLLRVARFNKGTQYLGLESFLPTKSMMEDATVEKVKYLDYFVVSSLMWKTRRRAAVSERDNNNDVPFRLLLPYRYLRERMTVASRRVCHNNASSFIVETGIALRSLFISFCHLICRLRLHNASIEYREKKT